MTFDLIESTAQWPFRRSRESCAEKAEGRWRQGGRAGLRVSEQDEDIAKTKHKLCAFEEDQGRTRHRERSREREAQRKGSSH